MGKAMNLYPYLTGSVLHNVCIPDCFEVHHISTITFTDNKAGLWWQHMGSYKCTFPLVHHLHLKEMHHQYHRYAPPTMIFSGVNNIITDNTS